LNLVINNFNLNQFTLKESNPLEGGCLTDSDKFDIIITSYTKDLSIVDHILKHLERDSVAALLTFPGVLFRSGRDKEIRERLIAKNLISAIIQLPSNSLSGTGIAPCIIVLSNKHQDKKGIHFIDTSRDPQKEFNTHKADAYYQCIADVYSNRDNIPHFSKFVSQEEIIENEGSLKVSTYIQPYSPIENHGSQNVINDWSRTYKFNNSTLTIRFGDVVTSDAEVIVSSDDTEISMGGGVSQSILEAGGDFVREDAQKKLPALLGDVIVSTAGKLAKQKYIFHCLTIDYTIIWIFISPNYLEE
jgi:type I restriction-modification system DNA methylase subunit